MMRNILIGAIFVAIVLAPCVISLLSGTIEYEDASESNVLEDGFI